VQAKPETVTTLCEIVKKQLALPDDSAVTGQNLLPLELILSTRYPNIYPRNICYIFLYILFCFDATLN